MYIVSEFNSSDINKRINPDELKEWFLDQKSNESLSLPSLDINDENDPTVEPKNNEINLDDLEKWFSQTKPSKPNEELLLKDLDADYEEDSVEELETITNNIGDALQAKQNNENVDKIQDNILIIEMLLDNNLLVTPERLGEIIDQFVSLIGQIKVNDDCLWYKEQVFLYQKDIDRHVHKNYLETIMCGLSNRLKDVLRYNRDDSYFNLIKERKTDILNIYNSFWSYESIICKLGSDYYQGGIGEACDNFIPFFQHVDNFSDLQSLSNAAREKFQDKLTDCYNKIVEIKQTGGNLTPFERMSKYIEINWACLLGDECRCFSFVYLDVKDLLQEFIDTVINDFNECKDSDNFEFWVFINDKYEVNSCLEGIIEICREQNEDSKTPQTLQNLENLKSKIENINFGYADLVQHFSKEGYIKNSIKQSGCFEKLEVLLELENFEYKLWNEYDFYCENQIDYIEAQINFLQNHIKGNKSINKSRYYRLMDNDDYLELGLQKSDVESLQTFDLFHSHISFIKHFEDTIKELFYQYRNLAFNLKSKIDSPDLSEQEKQNLEKKYQRAIKNRAQIYDVACELAGVKQDLLKNTYIKIQKQKLQKLSGFQKFIRIALLIITIPIHVPIFILKKTLFKFIGCSLLGLEVIQRYVIIPIFEFKSYLKGKISFKEVFEVDDCKDAWAQINSTPAALEKLKINGEEISKRIKWYETKNWLRVRRIFFPIDFAIHVFIGIFLAVKKFFKSIKKAFVNITEIIKDIYYDDPCSHIFNAKPKLLIFNSDILISVSDKITVVPKYKDRKLKTKNKFTDMSDPITSYYNILEQPKSFLKYLQVLTGFVGIKHISEYDEYMHYKSGIQRYYLIPDGYYESELQRLQLEIDKNSQDNLEQPKQETAENSQDNVKIMRNIDNNI